MLTIAPPAPDFSQRHGAEILLVNELVLAALPPHDILKSKEFASCAVVGASGHLLGENFGPEIDSHMRP